MSLRSALARLRRSRPLELPRDPIDAAPFGISDPVRRHWLMAARGLPVSAPVAFISPRGRGWTEVGIRPRGSAEWAETLLRHLPATTIVRPAGAAFGRGLLAVSRDGEEVRDADGGRWDVRGFAAELCGRPDRPWLVEDRLDDDPRMLALTGGRPLGTVIVVTRLGLGDDPPAIEKVALRTTARRGEPPRGILDPVPVADAGAVVPEWPAIADLVVRGASSTPQTPLAGWDVLITTDGPRIADVWRASGRRP
jgi:hypothetical protein